MCWLSEYRISTPAGHASASDIETAANPLAQKAARGPVLPITDRKPEIWRVRKIFDDPAADRDWGLDAEVDLAAFDDVGAPVIRVMDVGRMD